MSAWRQLYELRVEFRTEDQPRLLLTGESAQVAAALRELCQFSYALGDLASITVKPK